MASAYCIWLQGIPKPCSLPAKTDPFPGKDLAYEIISLMEFCIIKPIV